MSFASFCRVAGFENLPDVDLRPDELRAAHAHDVWRSLDAHTDTLTIAWQAFIEVGGYPQAVADWCTQSRIDEATWRALWEVVRGEALTKGFTEPALLAVLSGLSERIASHVVQQTLAADADLQPAALSDRIDALVQSFVLWRCPAGGTNRLPDLARRQKYYFIDSLPARLAELVHGSTPVDVSRITEQQLGVQLLQWNERVRPGSTRTSGWITHHRTERNEVDFAGRCADNGAPMTAIESKYSSSSWRRDALTLRNSLGGGLLATRDVLDIEREEPVWAVPVGMIAWALTASTH
jgi:predicted AAA+ superfamily ATPase